MMQNRRIKIWASFMLTVLVISGLFGCNNAPLTTPPPPPAPVVTGQTPAFPEESPTANTSNTPVPTAAELTVISNDATIHFPDDIVFSVTAKGPAVIKTITLEYGTDMRSLVPETSSSKAVFPVSQEVATSWTWLMKKTGSIPPGATIWWTWMITDADGKTITTTEESIVYNDTRFEWNADSYPDYDIFWHDQSSTLINELLIAMRIRLDRIELNVQIPAVRKPKVFIYKSTDELKDAILFEQEWTGAMAFPSYNIILTAINSSNLEWAKDALPHEITHLLVGEATFGPFGDIPTWLDEGLAQYAESGMPAYMKEIFDTAIADGTLMPISSLSGSFPTSTTAAYLAYAESCSIVNFLVEQYGWDKMQLLLETFKDGATYDQALLEVYSFDVDNLEILWKSYIGAN